MKTHAEWSGSATERNMACPGSIALAEDLPVGRKSSYAADWGTACHTLCEKALTAGIYEAGGALGEFIDVETQPGLAEQFEVDDTMVACADAYLGYIKDRIDAGYEVLGIEVKLDLADVVGNLMEVGGTADCVLYHREKRILEIVDLKTGTGHIVEVTGNPQARFYATGVLMAFPVPVDMFRSTIVQPRAPHNDGRIRMEEIDPVEMLDWSTTLLASVRKSIEARKAYIGARLNTVALDDWTSDWLNPGEAQCRFCPAAGMCPALKKLAMKQAEAWYDDKGTLNLKSNALRDNTPEMVERDLFMLDAMEEWIRQRRALAHAMAEAGTKFEQWELVEKVGNRKFVGDTDGDKIAALRAVMPLSDDQLFDRKLKSPAGLERAIGKTMVQTKLAKLIFQPVTGTDLVRIGVKARNRRPVQSTAEKFYE